MNGQIIFEQLKSMTKDERKQCCFWWLFDKKSIQNFLDNIIFDLKDEVKEEILNNIKENISVEFISKISDNILKEMSDYSYNGFWDECLGIITSKLQDYIYRELKKQQIEIAQD